MLYKENKVIINIAIIIMNSLSSLFIFDMVSLWIFDDRIIKLCVIMVMLYFLACPFDKIDFRVTQLSEFKPTF